MLTLERKGRLMKVTMFEPSPVHTNALLDHSQIKFVDSLEVDFTELSKSAFVRGI